MKKIELKHISILPLQTKLRIQKKQIQNQNALIQNSWIDDYQKLKDLYEKQEKYKWNIFTDDIFFEIEKVEKEIEKSNKKGHKPEIYLTKEEPQVYNYTFEKDEVDKSISGEVLLYGNPLEYSARRRKISNYSIYQLRHFLSHCETNGNNLLGKYIKTFGPYESQKLVKAINFYNLQLERQSLENDYELDDNKLFYIHKDLKREFLQDQIKEIAEYLVDTADECVWGELSDNQKLKILDSVLKENKGNNDIKRRLIDAIANYTTVREIESGLVKTKTIDRFIVK